MLTNDEPCPCCSGRLGATVKTLPGYRCHHRWQSWQCSPTSECFLTPAINAVFSYRGETMQHWCWEAILHFLRLSHFALKNSKTPNIVTYSRSQTFGTLMNISMSINIFKLELRLQTRTEPSPLRMWCWYRNFSHPQEKYYWKIWMYQGQVRDLWYLKVTGLGTVFQKNQTRRQTCYWVYKKEHTFGIRT